MPYKKVESKDFPENWDFEAVSEVEFTLVEKKTGVGKYNTNARKYSRSRTWTHRKRTKRKPRPNNINNPDTICLEDR